MSTDLSFHSFDLPAAEVRRRFEWAKRQGHPTWLWPDLNVGRWCEALLSIEDVARTVLREKQSSIYLDGEAAAIGVACYTSGVGPLLGYWHQQGRFSTCEDIASVLALHWRHNKDRAARMRSRAIAIIDSLTAQGIPVTVLKGAHTAVAYFEDEGMRPASDIDLLVKRNDMVRAENVIRAAGFEETIRSRFESSWQLQGSARQPRSLELTHAEDPWAIDLHHSIEITARAGAPIANLDDAEPMRSGRRWAPFQQATVLEQPVLLLHLAAHAGKAPQNLSLLRLIEIVLVVRQDFGFGDLSWQEFLRIGELTSALGYAYPALHLAETLAPGTVADFVLDRCRSRTPRAVQRMLESVTPATAQRIDRSSISEHFMWAESWASRLRQVAADIVPSTSLRELQSLYERRMWQAIRGKFER